MNHDLTAEEREKFMKWPCNVVERLEFRNLTDCFEQVIQLKSKIERYKTLLPGKLYKLVVDADESLFSLLRLIIPRADRSRGQYGLAVKKIAKIYISNLGLSGLDADRLELYTTPSVFAGCAGVVAGDFSSALAFVLKDRTIQHNDTSKRRLTIHDINNKLDELESVSKQDEFKEIFNYLLQHCSAKEQKWFIRILLQDLKIGVKEDGLLAYLHPDAKDMYNMCRELSLVCGVLRNPNKVHTPTLSPMLPCCPMLAAKSRTWKDVVTWISKSLNGGNKFCFEEKLDGHRILLHKKGDEVKVFSRRGLDHTDKYVQFFKKFANENILVDECILDGELVVWDNREKRISEFQSNMKSLFDHYLKVPGDIELSEITRNGVLTTDYSEMWPSYSIFDILYVGSSTSDCPNHEGNTNTSTMSSFMSFNRNHMRSINSLPNGTLLAFTLLERKKVLKKVIKPVLNLFYLTPYTILEKSFTDTPKMLANQLKDELDKIVSLRKEGLMLKATETPYVLGERSRNAKHWIKLKPEYLDTLAGYLDLIVLGGYYSSSLGGRAGLISHFLLGVKDDSVQKDTNTENLKFHTLCKVGTGYNVHTLRDINEKLMEQNPPIHHVHPKIRKEPLPKHFMGWKPSKTDDIPDVWFDPKKSIVFEIMGAEFQITEQFAAKVTVRFPRVRSV